MNSSPHNPSLLVVTELVDPWLLIQRIVELEIEVRELRRAAAERQFRDSSQDSQARQSGDVADDDCPF